MSVSWIETTPNEKLVERQAHATASFKSAEFQLTGEAFQKLRGFGGCFNELGYLPMQQLDNEVQEAIYKDLFSPNELNFRFNRTPVGANDFAATWYSYDETDGDLDLKNFSVDHDEQTLIPYIRRAQKYQPDMELFASPWSPPTWMKNPKVYNFGRIVMSPENLTAYANYLLKYVREYDKRGIKVSRLFVQNEVFADQKFPSCLWSSEDMKIFIRDYLGPLFKREKVPTDIFLGTLNGPEDMKWVPTGIDHENYNRYVDNILFDDEARSYIKGVGYQWAGQNAIARTHESWPELELLQTESECGFGENSWEDAEYIFHLINHYFRNGATAYTYWNIILGDSVSTWGWRQNSLYTIKSTAGESAAPEVIKNPEYYVMRHFAKYVQPGAQVLGTSGHFNSMAIAFRNPDGRLVVVVQNALERELAFSFADPADGSHGFAATLKPRSFNTFVVD